MLKNVSYVCITGTNRYLQLRFQRQFQGSLKISGVIFDHCMIPICEVGMEHDHDNPQQGRIKTFDRMYAFATQHVQAYGPCKYEQVSASADFAPRISLPTVEASARGAHKR